MVFRSLRIVAILSAAMAMASLTMAFQVGRPAAHLSLPVNKAAAKTTATSLLALGKKKEDLSFIETRDMTREEMLRLNAENERVMNAELVGMTVFSLIISLPLLYLAWVGLFADTAEIAMNN